MSRAVFRQFPPPLMRTHRGGCGGLSPVTRRVLAQGEGRLICGNSGGTYRFEKKNASPQKWMQIIIPVPTHFVYFREVGSPESHWYKSRDKSGIKLVVRNEGVSTFECHEVRYPPPQTQPRKPGYRTPLFTIARCEFKQPSKLFCHHQDNPFAILYPFS